MMFKRKNRLDRNVIVFTTHKAGSMVLHGVLRDVCDKNGIEYYSPNQTGANKMPFERIFKGEDFIAGRNGCFGALRFFVPSSALRTSNIILHLRDPRDVLTSMFFSYCFMHPAKYPGEIEANTGYRKAVADAGIDKFVLDMSDENYASYQGDYGTGCNFGTNIGNMRQRYDVYLNEVIGKLNAVVISYEEMVLDFRSWLRKVVAAYELDDENSTYNAIACRYADSVRPEEEEDVRSHKRKVTPGDYKEKLKPETISELNSRFRNTLEVLGYAGHEYETTGIPVVRTLAPCIGDPTRSEAPVAKK
jgi:hypothetical protein